MTVELLVATTNTGKLREYQRLLAGLPVVLRSLADLPQAVPEVAETGETFEANALLKAHAYSAQTGLMTLADDSGLMVDALNGAPSVHSARYAPTAEARNAKLLAALEGVPFERRTARFICVVAVVLPLHDGALTSTAEGRLEGHIAFSARGTHGFGYDPIFLLPDGRTVAELSPEEKDAVSHRGKALAKLKPLLLTMLNLSAQSISPNH
ncbi:MAG: RdgB/HAM1 family non-canonical purine NTP pyrophosphatase [Anaerolineae bacterium]|nr:RdgB/HAM1 family non-canonical purine NTP pyrophosphatase [Anaerolineae bacterium]MDW8298988.1 RdgB/HAM1 family non-canonical purine NTP pyrophosphatase [Anaerolineae bacterium]